MREYIEDLRDTLLSSSGPLAKKFLASFVKDITIDGDQVKVQYTLPVGPQESDVELGRVRLGRPIAPGVVWWTNTYTLKTG